MNARASAERLPGPGRIVEAVAVAVPEREVDVAAVARRCPATASARATPPGRGRSATARIVSRTKICSSTAREGGRVAGRDLVLAVAELGVVLLEHDPLRLERRHQVVDHVLRRRSCRSSRSTGCGRPARSRRSTARASENSFSNETSMRRPRSARRSHMRFRNERWHTGAGLPSRPIMSTSIAPVRGRVRQHPERLRVGPQPHLADRPHVRHRLQLVEAVHRLHGHGQADAARDPALEAVAAATPCRGWCRRCRSRGTAPGAGRARRRRG